MEDAGRYARRYFPIIAILSLQFLLSVLAGQSTESIRTETSGVTVPSSTDGPLEFAESTAGPGVEATRNVSDPGSTPGLSIGGGGGAGNTASGPSAGNIRPTTG